MRGEQILHNWKFEVNSYERESIVHGWGGKTACNLNWYRTWFEEVLNEDASLVVCSSHLVVQYCSYSCANPSLYYKTQT